MALTIIEERFVKILYITGQSILSKVKFTILLRHMSCYNYWCINCTCENKDIKGKRDFQVEKPESKEKRKERCPVNGSVMKLMGQKMYGGKTMDKETRIKSLKKRSKDHFNKEIKERKVDMIRRSSSMGGGIAG